MNPRLTLSLLPLICLAAPLCAQGDVDLRIAAKKGASVWLAQEMKNEQTIEMQGQEMETSQSTTRVCQLTVKDVDDKGNLIVETKIARVHGSMTMPMGMGDTDFDSAAPAEKDNDEDGMGGMSAMMTKAMMAGAGKSFTAKVSPFGKVVELMDGAADILKGAGGGGMMGGRSVDEGMLKQIVECAFGVLPEKPTAVGAKWQHKETTGGGRMPVEQAMEMTLAKVEADSFEITATGTVNKPEAPKSAGKGEDEEGQAAQVAEMMKNMKVKNGKLASTQKVSRQDGFVVESKNTVSMDVELSTQMGDMQMAMKMSTTVKRTTADAATAKKAAKEEPKKDEKKEEKKEEPKKEAGK